MNIKKIIMFLRNTWKDIAAALVLMGLIGISIKVRYNLGILIGFLILFVFFTFDQIKRIIFDLNVKKIYGIEFGDIDEEQLKENVRKEMEQRGAGVSRHDIDVVTETALNQITGVSYRGRYYEEMISYALKDLNLSYLSHLSGAVGTNRFIIDFVVKAENDRAIGIEAAYSDSRFLSKNKIHQAITLMNNFKKADNLSYFVLITNTAATEEDKKLLQEQHPPIDIIENVVSPDGILSEIERYFNKIDQNRKGSLEKECLNTKKAHD